MDHLASFEMAKKNVVKNDASYVEFTYIKLI